MIKKQQYEKILDNGLLLDHYFILLAYKEGLEVPTNKRVAGIVNLLTKKGYLLNGAITSDGSVLVEDILEAANTVVNETQKQKDFSTWVVILHFRCQEKLRGLIGMPQVRGKIHGKPYPFLPNTKDLEKVLSRMMKHYRIKDRERIEECIMKYIVKCHKANNWFPILQYYIMKGKMGEETSQLATDFDNDFEEETDNSASIHLA